MSNALDGVILTIFCEYYYIIEMEFSQENTVPIVVGAAVGTHQITLVLNIASLGMLNSYLVLSIQFLFLEFNGSSQNHKNYKHMLSIKIYLEKEVLEVCDSVIKHLNYLKLGGSLKNCVKRGYKLVTLPIVDNAIIVTVIQE